MARKQDPGEPEHGTYIWVTQIQRGDAVEIAQLTLPEPERVVATFARIERIYSPPAKNDETRDLDVWVELVQDYDLDDDRRRVLEPFQATWLLEEFFKQPRTILKKLKQRDF